MVMIAVIGVIIASYVVGCLSSTAETERQWPHRY